MRARVSIRYGDSIVNHIPLLSVDTSVQHSTWSSSVGDWYQGERRNPADGSSHIISGLQVLQNNNAQGFLNFRQLAYDRRVDANLPEGALPGGIRIISRVEKNAWEGHASNGNNITTTEQLSSWQLGTLILKQKSR
jgi:hypothetical protein